jgi:ligand-binding SRPBCC domain-containing protein
MTVHVLEREQFIARSVESVFSFFSEAQNLQRITPPWLGFELLSPAPIEMREGTLIEYRLRVHRLPLTWVSRIESWEYNRAFVDRQIHGPYQLWHHTHEFEGIGAGTLMRDRVRYSIPFGTIGDLARLLFVQRDLDNVFAFRHAATAELLEQRDN